MRSAVSVPDASTTSFAAFGKLRPGARLGDYEIVRMAGRGGMAVVWEARDATGATVAIKTMLPSVTLDPKQERAFVREGTLTSNVTHENVCAARSGGEHEGVLYLVMDWVDGAPLSTLRENEKIPHDIAARIALDAARGLHAAHLAKSEDGTLLGIVHRDVSPQNILISRAGVSKIADFGIALSSIGSTTNVVKGKARYMAPEQAYAEPVDPRTDVFALGIVLYEMVTGKAPYDTDNDVAILAKLASFDPIPPPEDVAGGLKDAIVRATSKESDARYGTMDEFAEALEPFASTRADVARWVAEHLEPSVPAAETKRASHAYVAVAFGCVLGAGALGVIASRDQAPSTVAPNVTLEPIAVASVIPTPSHAIEPAISSSSIAPAPTHHASIDRPRASVSASASAVASAPAPSASSSSKPFSAEALRTRE